MYAERLPPQDVEAEEAVIGSLLIDGEALVKVSSFLEPQHFTTKKNRWCYEACLSLNERNEAIDQITVAHELARKERLEEVGGPAYLAHVVSITPTPIHIEHYARTVHLMFMMRSLIEAAGQIATIGYEVGPDVDASLRQAENILFRLRRGQISGDFVHIREVLDEYLEESGFGPKPREGEVSYIKTGFIDLDELLGGLQRSDMLILAARPSFGKSTLALNIARHAALNQKANVAIFSLEMSKEQLVQRLLAMQAEVDSRHLRLGQHTPAEEPKIMEATGILAEAPIYVDDSPLLTMSQMRSKARRLHMEKGVDLVIVDYITLILPGDGAARSRVEEMSEISRSIKGLARELNVPILAVSQLSRAVEIRPTHRPILSDLRESGSIEQDADVVMFIYRDEFYYTKDEWERHFPEKPYPKGKAEIIVAKQRHGPTGEVALYFRDKIAKFEDFWMGGS